MRAGGSSTGELFRRASQQVVTDTDGPSDMANDTVSVLRSQFGLRCFGLDKHMMKLMGLCSQVDTIDMELLDQAADQLKTPLTYSRLDLGEKAWQLMVWKRHFKIVLPDHLELKDLKEGVAPLYLQQVATGKGFDPLFGEPKVPARIRAKDIVLGFHEKLKAPPETVAAVKDGSSGGGKNGAGDANHGNGGGNGSSASSTGGAASGKIKSGAASKGPRTASKGKTKAKSQPVNVKTTLVADSKSIEDETPETTEPTGPPVPADPVFLEWAPVTETQAATVWKIGEDSLHPSDKIVFFKPLAQLVFRTPDAREIVDKEAVFTHLLFVESILIGCRIEIDRDTGLVTHDSRTVKTELDMEEDGKVLGRRESTISRVRRTFHRAIQRQDDLKAKEVAIGKKIDARGLQKWIEDCLKNAIPVNWEVGPVTLRRTEDVKRRIFSQHVPTCTRGHTLFVQRYDEVHWSATKEMPCRVCKKMQAYALETCKSRCEFYGICQNCAAEWQKIDMRLKEEYQASIKRESAYSRIEVAFPLIAPELNPPTFIRFQICLNMPYADYLRNPYEVDTRLISEMASLLDEGGISELGVASQLAVVGCTDHMGLQSKLDIILAHPRFRTHLASSRHFRQPFAKDSVSLNWLPQHENLFHLATVLLDRVEALQQQRSKLGILSAAAAKSKGREDIKGKYPLFSVCRKLLLQQAVCARRGFEELLYSKPPPEGVEPKQGSPAKAPGSKDGPICKEVPHTIPRELVPQSRLVSCPMVCGIDVVDTQLATHKLKLCKKRNAECDLGCGTKLVYEEMEQHMGQECPNRGVCCPMCNNVIQAKMMKEHAQTCAYRPMVCERCGSEYPLCRQEDHNRDCPQREVICNWCGDVVIACRLLRPHKRRECRMRYQLAIELNDAIYRCNLEEVQRLLEDGCLPTTKFDAVQEQEDLLEHGNNKLRTSSSPILATRTTAQSTISRMSPHARHGSTDPTLPAEVAQHPPNMIKGQQDSDSEFCRSNFVGLSLHAAAVVDQLEICELLLARGADLYAVDKFGRTALHVAAAYGACAVLDALLVADAKNALEDHQIANKQKKSSYNKQGAPASRPELAAARDEFGRTALFLAGFHQRNACVDLLHDVSPYTPRTEKQCDSLLNILRYDERKEQTFAYLKKLPNR
ncbi:unnamed protein product [Amoebophrya sp. A25]|nr:unnamed protein product [Amoebophrya sp. A25]|eukprot:GSA25T00023089001.1